MSGLSNLVRLSATRAPARAKINLALHVIGRREDGFHELSSLVAFAADGDRLTVMPAAANGLSVTGRFAEALRQGETEDNIVVKALSVAREVASRSGTEFGPLAITLDKALPVASGIGGGSADAAALLRLVAGACPEIAGELRQAALRLGADVPMCLDGWPALVGGIGETGTRLRSFPALPCLLVNPGIAVPTPDVFRLLQGRFGPALPAIPGMGFASLAELTAYLRETRNDLEAPAAGIAASVPMVRAALLDVGASFARMSGSGATVFGLFRTSGEADDAAKALAVRYPDWWIMATRLMPASGSPQ